jgi:large subunit ribosomal protein L6
MSRIAKKPLILPAGIQVAKEGERLVVKGKQESLTVDLLPGIDAEFPQAGQVQVVRRDDQKQTRAFHGLVFRLLTNAVVGLSTGYKKELDIVGTGFKAELKGQDLTLALGFSHPVAFSVPAGVKVAYDPKANRLTLTSADKQLIGQVAANIRGLRPPDSYKGKGVKYSDQKLKLKVGKAGA